MANKIDQRQNFLKGIIKENPVFVMLLGMCPTLGVTSSAFNGLGMGVATLFVLLMSNIVVSLVKLQIPNKVRIPAFIIIIASFVTIVEMVLEAFIPFLYEQLGIFIPLIVVNCLILGRAEAFASKNNLVSSIIDAFGMGIGFVIALTILGATREILVMIGKAELSIKSQSSIIKSGFLLLKLLSSKSNELNTTIL